MSEKPRWTDKFINDPPMMNADLMRELQKYPPDMEVTSCWDTVTGMCVNGVHCINGRIVIDCETRPLTREELERYENE